MIKIRGVKRPARTASRFYTNQNPERKNYSVMYALIADCGIK
jgi:hypothetical protein